MMSREELSSRPIRLLSRLMKMERLTPVREAQEALAACAEVVERRGCYRRLARYDRRKNHLIEMKGVNLQRVGRKRKKDGKMMVYPTMSFRINAG